ncbi:MAG: AzlD domain-containing protein [Agathobacter sp.]|nr:AzlD domain-containing protein [Agathobacter sp.]
MTSRIYLYILVMASVTYLIRMLPLVLAKKEITNIYIKSFLHYVPYACLAAMTFPAILFSTASWISALAGFGVAIFTAYKKKSLLTVALLACLTAFLVERILCFIV